MSLAIWYWLDLAAMLVIWFLNFTHRPVVLCALAFLALVMLGVHAFRGPVKG